TDRIGTNLRGLVEAAEPLGLTARAVKGPYDALPQVPVPAIAHTRTAEGLGHFVVIHKATAKGVVIADPGRGVERLSRDEFGRQVDLALIAGYARHVLRLPVRFFEARQVGEVISRVHDAAKVREAVSGTAVAALVDGLLVLLLTAILFLYDASLALAAVAFVP